MQNPTVDIVMITYIKYYLGRPYNGYYSALKTDGRFRTVQWVKGGAVSGGLGANGLILGMAFYF